MEIIYQKLITDPLDFFEADFIDFHRLNGYWDNPRKAIETIFSWSIGKATMTIVDIPTFFDAPRRSDFPGWIHTGGHNEIGRKYWDWFFWNHPGGKLFFGDSPDFHGVFPEGQRFWADIGQVSISAFAEAQKFMRVNDLWISVLGNGKRQVLIESHINISKMIDIPYIRKPKQLSMF